MLRGAIPIARQAITIVTEHHRYRIKPLNPPKELKLLLALNLHAQVKALIQLAM